MQCPRSVRARFAAATAAAAVALVAASGLGSPQRAHAAAPRACATSGLVVWLNTTSNGAAGSFYYTLELTNLSGAGCTLSGYPGVSAVSLDGTRIGSAATRTPGGLASAVALAKGATATVTLRITDVLNFPASTCKPTTAAGLRVYPPGQTASRIVPGPFRACSRTGTIFMNIGPAS